MAVTALLAPTALQDGSLPSAVSQGTSSGQPLTLKLELGHREPLQGKELEAFYASRAAHALLEEEDEEPQPSLTPRCLPGSPSCGQAKQAEHQHQMLLGNGPGSATSKIMDTTGIQGIRNVSVVQSRASRIRCLPRCITLL